MKKNVKTNKAISSTQYLNQIYAAITLILILFLFFRRKDYFGDPFIDWGYELFIPWGMLNGQTLYENIYYLFLCTF